MEVSCFKRAKKKRALRPVEDTEMRSFDDENLSRNCGNQSFKDGGDDGPGTRLDETLSETRSRQNGRGALYTLIPHAAGTKKASKRIRMVVRDRQRTVDKQTASGKGVGGGKEGTTRRTAPGPRASPIPFPFIAEEVSRRP